MQKEWLQLIHLKGLPVAAKRALVGELGSPTAVLRLSASARAKLLEQLGVEVRRSRATAKAAQYPHADSDVEILARIGADFIGFNEADFPPLLNQISDPPLGLFVLGERALLHSPQLAIVGSRTPTPTGRRATERFAAELCALGLSITSGMARGIDHCAHRGCLDAAGATIAVTATGIDVAYPRANESLYREIAEKGLVVSEYPPGTPPMRAYFPQRNRIISGLALGTLVVEAGIRSGSLITARLAGEQGREVFAVPGSIHSSLSRGCHHLLRQGAKLVETTSDILEEIGQFFTPAPPRSAAAPKHAPRRRDLPPLYNLIDYTPTSMDELIARSGLTADQVSYILMELELEGLIASSSAGYQKLPQ